MNVDAEAARQMDGESNVNLIFDTINTKRDATECLVYKCL